MEIPYKCKRCEFVFPHGVFENPTYCPQCRESQTVECVECGKTEGTMFPATYNIMGYGQPIVIKHFLCLSCHIDESNTKRELELWKKKSYDDYWLVATMVVGAVGMIVGTVLGVLL